MGGILSAVGNLFKGSIGSIAGGLIGGVGDYYAAKSQANSQREANEQNYQMFQEGNAFNAAQAQAGRDFASSQMNSAMAFNAAESDANRQFQQMMSNTAYQRAVGDMKSAGLNPMLAYSQGGASAASGSAASVGATGGPSASAAGAPRMEAVTVPKLASSVLSSAGNIADLEIKAQQADLLKAQAEKTREQIPQEKQRAADMQREASFQKEIFYDRIYDAKHYLSGAENRKNLEAARLEAEELENKLRKGDVDMIQYRQKMEKLNGYLTELGVPEKEAYSKYYKAGGALIPAARDAGALINSATGAVGSIIGGVLRGRRGTQPTVPRETRSRSYSETHYDKDGNVVRGMSRDYQGD